MHKVLGLAQPRTGIIIACTLLKYISVLRIIFLSYLQHGSTKMSFSQFVTNLERIGVKLPRDMLRVSNNMCMQLSVINSMHACTYRCS